MANRIRDEFGSPKPRNTKDPKKKSESESKIAIEKTSYCVYLLYSPLPVNFNTEKKAYTNSCQSLLTY